MKKKVMSLVLAMAMILSALPAATAANAEPLSENAGKTIPVQVFEQTEDGITSRIINVAIPEGATQKEEAALLSYAASPNSAARSVNGTDYGLSYMRYLLIEQEERRIGGGVIPANDIRSVTTVLSVSESSSDNQLLLLYHRENSGVVNQWRPLYAAPGIRQFVFYSVDYSMNEGTNISIYAKVPEGHGMVYLDYCSVTANGYS